MKRIVLLILMTFFISKGQAQKFISSHTVGNETKTYSKVLVVVKSKNATQRAELEDDVVQRLLGEDIEAVPSYLRLSNEMIKTMGKNEKALEGFALKLKQNGFDGILVTSLVNANKSFEFNPSEFRTATVPIRYGRFGRYYGTTTI